VATDRVTALAGSKAESGPCTQPDNRTTSPSHSARHGGCQHRAVEFDLPLRLDIVMKKLGHPLPLGTRSAVAIARHPIHPMVVPFPIAFLMGVVFTDLAYLALGDPFWARVSLWLAGAGTALGLFAGLVGTLELLIIRGIRHRAAGWSHFVMAVMLLAVGFINWLSRLEDPQLGIEAGGLYLSLLGAALVAMAGWLGGELVFEHHVGLGKHQHEDRAYERHGHGDQ
jgi:uncharacterized membrane protein